MLHCTINMLNKSVIKRNKFVNLVAYYRLRDSITIKYKYSICILLLILELDRTKAFLNKRSQIEQLELLG